MPGPSELVALRARVAVLERKVERLERILAQLLKKKPPTPSKKEEDGT